MRPEGRRPLGPSSAGMLLTPEEFDAVDDYDDRYLYELIFGVLVVRPYPPPTEAAANDELGYWLRSYRDQHPKGKTLSATLPHQLSPPR